MPLHELPEGVLTNILSFVPFGMKKLALRFVSRQFEGVLGCRECHVHRPELDDEDFPVDAAKIPEHVLQPLAYLSTWSLGSFGSSKALEVLHVDTDYRTMGREFDMDTKMIGVCLDGFPNLREVKLCVTASAAQAEDLLKKCRCLKVVHVEVYDRWPDLSLAPDCTLSITMNCRTEALEDPPLSVARALRRLSFWYFDHNDEDEDQLDIDFAVLSPLRKLEELYVNLEGVDIRALRGFEALPSALRTVRIAYASYALVELLGVRKVDVQSDDEILVELQRV